MEELVLVKLIPEGTSKIMKTKAQPSRDIVDALIYLLRESRDIFTWLRKAMLEN